MESLKEIYKQFLNEEGGCGDKGNFHSYLDFYEKVFTKREEVNFLEIGVMQGHSAMMWSRYFKNSNVICVDIANKLKFHEDGWRFVLANATRASFSENFPTGCFDYIVDDGSHVLEDQVLSFFFLFPKLKQGGKYIIEDVQNIDKDLDYFKRLHSSVEVIDLRHERPLKDNVLVCYTR